MFTKPDESNQIIFSIQIDKEPTKAVKLLQKKEVRLKSELDFLCLFYLEVISNLQAKIECKII